MCPPADADRVSAHLSDTGLPWRLADLSFAVTSARLLDHMGRDKKTRDGALTLILARGIGRAFVARNVTPDAVGELLHAEGAG